MRIVLIVLAYALCGLISAARAQAPPPIVVTGAWSRATPGGSRTAAVYGTVVDHGPADRITGLSTPIADGATLHAMHDDGGVMTMRALSALPVPGGGAVMFAPGGLHVMLTGLRQALRPGDRFPLTFIFARAAPVTTQVRVSTAAAMAAPDGTAPGGTMPGMMTPR